MSTKCETCNQTTEYQGWKNYETWAVGLWLMNEESSYNDVVSLSRDAEGDATDLALQLREYVEELLPNAGEASLQGNLIGAALSEVDFYELAEHYIADFTEVSA